MTTNPPTQNSPQGKEVRHGAALHQSALAELTGWRCLPGRRMLLLAGLGIVPLIAVPFWWDVLYLVIGFDVVLLAGMFADYFHIRRTTHVRLMRQREHRLSVGTDNPITLVMENFGESSVRIWARDSFPGEFESAGDDIGTNDAQTLGQTERRTALEIGNRRSARELGDSEDEAEEEAERGALGLRRRLARELSPGGTVGPGVMLQSKSRVEIAYTVTPLRRGDYDFGDIHLRMESRLKLATVAAIQPAAGDVKVYPNIRGVRHLGLATRFKDLQHLGLKNIRKEGGGGEFAKLRDYVQGDDFRDINWKATARRRKPITQVYESERSQTVIICIDAGRLMAARMGNLTKLDCAINAALLLAYTALNADDRVGLVVFSDQIQTWLPPGRGPGQYRRILQALYGIEPHLCHVDYNDLITYLLARVRQRSLVVMFTDIQDEARSRPLVDYTRLLLPRHLPLCITLSDSNLLEMRNSVPSTAPDVFDRAVATELLREREILKSELVRLGAHVVDKPSESITVETINTYVDLKRRRLL